MALGVIVGWLSNNVAISAGSALALAVGFAIKLSGRAIVSLPMHAGGIGRKRAFGYGVLSGVVEPVASVITMLLATRGHPLSAILLSFASRVMMYVVVEELIPETAQESTAMWGFFPLRWVYINDDFRHNTGMKTRRRFFLFCKKNYALTYQSRKAIKLFVKRDLK